MALIRKETCIQYFKRRLSEGWKCISLDGYNAVLLSPDGIRREIDLRNDTLTLVPDGTGDSKTLSIFPNLGEVNWEDVDDPVGSPDDNATYVFATGRSAGEKYDLYNLSDHTAETGTINFVRVYIRCKSAGGSGITARSKIKTNATVYTGAINNPVPTSWTDYSDDWDFNPFTLVAWTWDEIDALQAGILIGWDGDTGYCTQVYVEVDYTGEGPPPSEYSSYKTFIGSVTSWTWNSGQYGTSTGVTAASANATLWMIDKIQNSSNVFYPIGTLTNWRWLSGSSTLT